MTHRVYIDEYNKEFIHQLSNNNIEGLTATDESTNKVIVISGEMEDLQKVCSLMYVEDENKIKEVFPSFQTIEDVERMAREEASKVYDSVRDSLLTLINNASHRSGLDLYRNEDYKILHEIWTNYLG